MYALEIKGRTSLGDTDLARWEFHSCREAMEQAAHAADNFAQFTDPWGDPWVAVETIVIS
jgi:hypothetical protein